MRSAYPMIAGTIMGPLRRFAQNDTSVEVAVDYQVRVTVRVWKPVPAGKWRIIGSSLQA
jgi:hypothetical protein